MMDVDKLARFLQNLTNDGIMMRAPIDADGVNSEFSLTWDFLARSHRCPPALEKVNRIMWRDHAILILHQGRTAAAPCHQCAGVGHQTSVCPKKNPEDWFTESALIVTDDMINSIVTDRRTWTTPDQVNTDVQQQATNTKPPEDATKAEEEEHHNNAESSSAKQQAQRTNTEEKRNPTAATRPRALRQTATRTTNRRTVRRQRQRPSRKPHQTRPPSAMNGSRLCPSSAPRLRPQRPRPRPSLRTRNRRRIRPKWKRQRITLRGTWKRERQDQTTEPNQGN